MTNLLVWKLCNEVVLKTEPEFGDDGLEKYSSSRAKKLQYW